ncbi:MAG: fused MFS/spermidine synthase [Desulfovibrio sp.]|jgi:spermidine synthase|nr:fused MFS/spermidine synthase [Desulfovibrio sp.]
MLAAVVFLNGTAVMVLEMTGARLLAPHFGSSVVVWTCIIGVIMAGLSLGCALGGRLADALLRVPAGESGKRGNAAGAARKADAALSGLLAGAAFGALLTAALGMVLPGLFARSGASVYVNALLSSLCLFTPPGLLCGMITPYATRLRIHQESAQSRQERNIGRIIGRMNALATVGSIAGTFLGGFVLLSFFSTVSILLGVALCLTAAAALAGLRPLAPKLAAALIAVAGLAGNAFYAQWMEHTGFARDSRPISVETPYASLRVGKGEERGRKVLLLASDPGSAQSAMYVDDPAALVFAYTRFYALPFALKPDARRILMLGGGGYSVPKYLLSDKSWAASGDISLDVVELDPGMTATARKYFRAPLDDARMRVMHEDARAFVNRTAAALPADSPGPYDLIFADIFNSWYTVPFHVGTRQAAAGIRRLLADDGVCMMNIITAVSGDKGRLLRAVRGAFAESFEQVEIFPVQYPHSNGVVQNVMLMALPRKRKLPDPATERVAPAAALALRNRAVLPFPDPDPDAPPLDDDFAPVELYTLKFTD